jgi:dTDP-4-dehydrorhamnose 3,5-epimerase-like enzyme
MNPLEQYLSIYTQASPTPSSPPAPVVVAEPLPGVRVVPLRWHADARGALCEMHRSSWDVLLDRAGNETHDYGAMQERRADIVGAVARQVYVSETRAGTVKGWHLHTLQVDRFACLRGSARLVLADLRQPLPDSARLGRVAEISIYGLAAMRALGFPIVSVHLDATRAPVRVEVPPGIAHGWLALEDCAILNAVSREYDGTDEWRTDPHGPVAEGWPKYLWRETLDG